MRGTWRWSRSEQGRGSRELPRDGTLAVRPGRRGVVVRADRGVVHVTQSGDPEDHVLEAGEEIRLPGGGRVVAFALRAARVTVLDACPARPGFTRCEVGPGYRVA